MRRSHVLCGLGLIAAFVIAGCESDTRDPGPDPDPDPVVGACDEPATLACATPLAVQVPVDGSGTTAGAADGFGGSECGRGGDGVPDQAFEWVAPRAGRYDITTAGSDFDTVLSVRRGGCDGEEIACNDDMGRMMLQSLVTVELAECERIVIVVDGFDASATGSVQVRVTGRESLCADGEDGDGDGLTDCDDPDCFSVECAGDDWPAAWTELEWQVLELTNQYRAMGYNCDSRGEFGPAPALEMDATIQVAARGHSVDMGQNNYFEHETIDGVCTVPARGEEDSCQRNGGAVNCCKIFSERMAEAGFSGDAPWGENIAAGQRTAASVVEGWMESDGHCANIMNPSYRVIGIGYAEEPSSDFGTYWTQNFAGSH